MFTNIQFLEKKANIIIYEAKERCRFFFTLTPSILLMNLIFLKTLEVVNKKNLIFYKYVEVLHWESAKFYTNFH